MPPTDRGEERDVKNHPGLFDKPPHGSKELARTEDPGTSKKAAEEMVASGSLGRRTVEALNHLKHTPGSTATELETRAGVSDGRYRKRLNDLRKRGHAKTVGTRKCRVTGRAAQVWYPTAASLESSG